MMPSVVSLIIVNVFSSFGGVTPVLFDAFAGDESVWILCPLISGIMVLSICFGSDGQFVLLVVSLSRLGTVLSSD